MNDWVKYLQPTNNAYNCCTFLENIHPSIKVWNNELQQLYNQKKHKWGDLVTFEDIHRILYNRLKVDIKDLKPYDLLIFGISDKRPQHFGLYIGNNQFIHYRKIPKIDDLTEEWRKKLKVIYR